MRQVDEAIYRQPSPDRVRRRQPGVVDQSRMQRITPIHDHSIEDALHIVDTLEQRAVSIDVSARRGIFAAALLRQAIEVRRMACFIDVLEPTLTMPVDAHLLISQ